LTLRHSGEGIPDFISSDFAGRKTRLAGRDEFCIVLGQPCESSFNFDQSQIVLGKP
jgi:hypothetical protein